MSTNAYIACKLADGTYRYVYLHFDGYPSHAFEILKEHYNSQELAELVTSLGDMSVLGPRYEPEGKHTYNSPEEGVCVLYGRDRGEDDVGPRITTRGGVITETYNYIWDGGGWGILP